MEVKFIKDGNKSKIIETFDAEGENTLDLQKNGWQAILDNFKQFAENITYRIGKAGSETRSEI